jgi:hypothetical protein
LRPRPLNRRALPTIQQPKLNAGMIRRTGHNTIQRINLANQMPLAQTTNRRIAGHHANAIAPQRHKRRAGTHTRGSRCSLTTCMAAANHNDIKMFHVKRSYFPIQKLENISPSNVSTSTRPINTSKARAADRKSSAINSAIA